MSRLALSIDPKQIPRQNMQEKTSSKLPLTHTITDRFQSTSSESDRSLKQQLHEPPHYEPDIRREQRGYSSEIVNNPSDEGNVRATIVVPQLPRIPLALMPCPREEDESKVDDESSHLQSKYRNIRRNSRI